MSITLNRSPFGIRSPFGLADGDVTPADQAIFGLMPVLAAVPSGDAYFWDRTKKHEANGLAPVMIASPIDNYYAW